MVGSEVSIGPGYLLTNEVCGVLFATLRFPCKTWLFSSGEGKVLLHCNHNAFQLEGHSCPEEFY